MLASKNSAEPHIRQLLDCIVGVAFMGTPHCGSDLSNWAKMFGNFTNIFKKTNTSLLGTLEPQSEVLARIQKEFHTMLRARRDDGKKQLLITCFFEELPVRGIGEVKCTPLNELFTSFNLWSRLFPCTQRSCRRIMQ
jgi:protein SERAC1